MDPVLYNREFFIICMQEDLDPWEDVPVDMLIGTSTFTLTNGMWSTMDGTQGAVISNASRNMYYNNIDAVLADPHSYGDGYIFQLATWYITTGYEDGIWSGALDATKLDDIFAHGQTLFPDSPRTPEQEERVYEFLLTSLNEAEGEMYFLQIPDMPEFQPYAIVVIPEASSILLLSSSLVSMFLLGRVRPKNR